MTLFSILEHLREQYQAYTMAMFQNLIHFQMFVYIQFNLCLGLFHWWVKWKKQSMNMISKLKWCYGLHLTKQTQAQKGLEDVTYKKDARHKVNN